MTCLGSSRRCYGLTASFSLQNPVRHAVQIGSNVTNPATCRVADLAAERARLFALDFSLVADARPATACGGALIQFFMSSVFSLVELIEAPDYQRHHIRES